MEDASPEMLSLFVSAIERPSPEERAAFVAEVCGTNNELRHRMEALLRAHDEAGGFLKEPPAANDPQATSEQSNTEHPGTVIGPYKLLEEIGEGGMGTVWMAQQTEPVKRLVAVKLIKAGMDSKQVIARFEAERQAVALMDHPNIARVLAAGTTDAGRPYFVMDLVKGVPITRYCDEHRFTPRQRLELFVPVCQAVQHAHQKGIIHRDLKPTNVLVALYDGRPVPKVIDFGVAKATGQTLTEKTLVTGFGAVVGTLEYMSPEQAEMNQLDIDTRSDIYSLGVLLYELLTGSPPFTKKDLEKAGILEMLRVIREQEPRKPSTKLSSLGSHHAPRDEPGHVSRSETATLASVAANRSMEPTKLTKLVRGELDWIVMKALEKDRKRRYETASAFAADVQRYLRDEPVLAGPPSAVYRFRKFVRRNKTGLAVAALLLFFLVLLGGGAGWVVRDQAARRDSGERRAHDALQEAGRLRDEEKWPEAVHLVAQAEAVLAASGGGGDLLDQARRMRRDLEIGQSLDEARLLILDDFHGEEFHKAIDAAYALAFAKCELDPESVDPQDAADQVRASPIGRQLTAALDYWAYVRKRLNRPGWQRRLEIARLADEDRLRNRLRDSLEGKDDKALEEVLQLPSPDAWPVSTLILVAQLARGTDLSDQVANLLRRTQQLHPSDYWINLELAESFAHSRPPNFDEAVHFTGIAVALQPNSVGAHNNLAAALKKQGKVDAAIVEYRMAIDANPKHFVPHYNLGIELNELGKQDEAIAEYRKAIALAPTFSMTHNNLGVALKAQGKLDDAIAEYRKALALDPENAAGHLNLANALIVQGKLNEGVEEAQKGIDLNPKRASSYSVLASALHAQGKDDAAVVELRKAIAIDGHLAKLHSDLGVSLAELENYNESVVEYHKAIDLDPKLAVAHAGLGYALNAQRKFDNAIAELNTAISLDPKDAIAYLNLGNALFTQGRVEEAIAKYRKALDIEPNKAEVHSNLGGVLLKQRKLEEAVEEFRRAIAINPKLAAAHENLGSALADQGKLDEALIACRRALECNPKSATAQNVLGNVLLSQAKPAEAVEAYKRAIAIEPMLVEAHNGLGKALADQGKLDEAIAEYGKALGIDPTYAHAHHNLGMALSAQNKVDDAIAAQRKAIRLCNTSALQPLCALAYTGLGECLHRQGKREDAISAFRKAIELMPSLAEPHFDLGLLLDEQGNLDEAIGEYRKGIERDRKNAWAYNNVGIILVRQGKLREAMVEYDASLEADPDYTPALWNLSTLLACAPDPKLRDSHKAVELAKRGVALQGHAGWWQTLGWAHYRAGAWKESIAALEKSIELNKAGADPDQWLFLAMAHWKLGQKEEARQWYDRSVQWIDKNPEALEKEQRTRVVEDVRKIRAEAAELLGVK
jgi:tetratricopeptide (TPR) repeat protein/serine/threonine protein kinase